MLQTKYIKRLEREIKELEKEIEEKKKEILARRLGGTWYGYK